MATEEQIAENCADSKRKAEDDTHVQKKLRSSGQEYVSKTGKLMPSKVQPDVICTCPQHCNDKISTEARMKLFTEFYSLEDQNKQNEFLRAHIRAQAVRKRSPDCKTPKRAKRRVSCKYQVPLLSKPDVHIQPGPSPPEVKLIEICQKAFMNIFVITEKRVRLQREKLISEVLGTKAVPYILEHMQPEGSPNSFQAPLEEPIDMSLPKNTTEIDVTILKEQQHDIALVDNFFMNQLWKPEYINTAIQ